MTSRAVIFGCSGPVLTREERAFFRDVRPWGFILFARNVETPDQVRRLTDSLRDAIGRPEAPILIDQEGGRVQRMRPPHWRRYPPGRAYGQIAGNDPLLAREVARLGARLIAHDLAGVGINVDCVPVLDVPDPSGHEIIGDRAYGQSPEEVIRLGRAAAEGLIAGGVCRSSSTCPATAAPGPTPTWSCRWWRRPSRRSSGATSPRSRRSPTCRSA